MSAAALLTFKNKRESLSQLSAEDTKDNQESLSQGYVCVLAEFDVTNTRQKLNPLKQHDRWQQ
jgi:hypothetical protein